MTIKAAAASFEPWKWHKAENADRMADFYERAVKSGARVVVGPECALDGYVTYEAIDFPDRRERLLEIAEPIDGSYIAKVRRLAKKLRTNLVFGFAERTDQREVYNTAIFIRQDGEIAGRHHKMQFAEGYEESWYFNRLGSKLRSFDTPFGRAGIMICNDRWSPQIARALVLDGAQYLCILSHGNRRRVQDRAVLARARENGVPIIQANVGVNLIISRGEFVARDTGKNLITVGEIDIPAHRSAAAARRVEQEFLRTRPRHMRNNLKRHMEKHRRESRKRSDAVNAKPVWRTPKLTDHSVCDN